MRDVQRVILVRHKNERKKIMEDMVIQFNGVHLLIVMAAMGFGLAAGYLIGWQTRDESDNGKGVL